MLTHRSGLCGVWGSQGWWVRTVGKEAPWHYPHTPPSTCPPTLSSAPALHTETQLGGKTENMRHVGHLRLSDIKSDCDFIMWLSCQDKHTRTHRVWISGVVLNVYSCWISLCMCRYMVDCCCRFAYISILRKETKVMLITLYITKKFSFLVLKNRVWCL